MWRIGILVCTLLVGMQNDAVAVENTGNSKKMLRLPQDPATPLPGTHPRETRPCTQTLRAALMLTPKGKPPKARQLSNGAASTQQLSGIKRNEVLVHAASQANAQTWKDDFWWPGLRVRAGWGGGRNRQ